MVEVLLNPEAGPIVAAVIALFPLAWIVSSVSKVLVATLDRSKEVPR
jgi:hypothetical protein